MADNKKDIHILQADIIYKALYYVCKNENVELTPDQIEVFRVLAEINPADTQASDCLHVMDNLKEFIKTHDTYKEYFEGNGENEKYFFS